MRFRDGANAAGRDLGRLREIWERAATCDARLVDWLGRRIAVVMYDEASRRSPPDETMLTASLAYARPWQTLAFAASGRAAPTT